MNKFKVICIFILGVLTGLCFAAVILKYQYVKNIIKAVNWESIVPVLSLFAGALIPIYITYKTIKTQEIVKLKSEFVKANLDVISMFKTHCFFLRTNVMYEKTQEDMITDYELDEIDKSTPKLRGPMILQTHESFDDFNFNYQLLAEGIRRLRNNRINNYINHMSTYILNLMNRVKKTPDENLWELSIIVKDDLFTISDEIEEILNDFLDTKLFKLDLKGDRKMRDVKLKKIEEKMNKTNLLKYKNEIQKLYNK